MHACWAARRTAMSAPIADHTQGCQDAQRFFQTLFTPYTPDNTLRLEIRPLHPIWRKEELYPNGDAPYWWASQTPWGTREWFRLTEQGFAGAARHALSLATRYEVYVGVLPRLGRKGKQENVDRAFCLWCDLDGGIDGLTGAR